MSKQIAILIDNSGSMFEAVGNGNTSTKIQQTSAGVQYFIQNLIDHIASVGSPGQWALSVHRFATSYQLLSGQVETSAGLSAMLGAIPAIENEAASQAAVGELTNLYAGIQSTASYMGSHTPTFGSPSTRFILLFSDGIQTIPTYGYTLAQYETDNG